MGFYNSKPWCKIPSDLLDNKAMLAVVRQIPHELRYLPFMLYQGGASRATPDGIFDVEDGSEFAELCLVDNPEDVFLVLREMMAKKIIANIPGSSIYIFKEWDYSGKGDRSLEQRVKIAIELWKEKQKTDTFFCGMSNNLDTLKNDVEPGQKGVKNPIQHYTQGGSQIREIEKDKIEKFKESTEIRTHTQEPLRIDCVADENRPAALITPGRYGEDSDLTDTKEFADSQNLFSETDAAGNCNGTEVEEKENALSVPCPDEKTRGEVCNILSDFFKDNNPAYDVQKGLRLVNVIADRIFELRIQADRKELAKSICKVFDEIRSSDDERFKYWRDLPYLPQRMANQTVWSMLAYNVAQKYNQPETSVSSADQYQREYEHHQNELRAGANFLDDEYLKYGISPTDPNRVAKLLLKKNGQK